MIRSTLTILGKIIAAILGTQAGPPGILISFVFVIWLLIDFIAFIQWTTS